MASPAFFASCKIKFVTLSLIRDTMDKSSIKVPRLKRKFSNGDFALVQANLNGHRKEYFVV